MGSSKIVNPPDDQRDSVGAWVHEHFGVAAHDPRDQRYGDPEAMRRMPRKDFPQEDAQLMRRMVPGARAGLYAGFKDWQGDGNSDATVEDYLRSKGIKYRGDPRGGDQ